MYPDESKYVFDEDTAIENVDYWYIDFFGEKIRQRKCSGGGTITEYGGPAGDGYTDVNGDS